MQPNESPQPQEVIEVPAACYRKRAGKARMLSYVRVQKVGKDGRRRTVFTFMWT